MTLPSTTGLPSGWSMGFATDNGKALTVQVNGTSGGHILYPLANGAAQTSLTLAGNPYEYVTLQYDGGGNFRVEQVTPATAQQLGMAGIGGVVALELSGGQRLRAAVADNGSAISAFNSPLGYLTVTLPSTTAINTGWTMAIANDNGKIAAVQVNGTGGGKILYPGSGASVDLAAARGGRLRECGAAIRRVEFPGHAADAGERCGRSGCAAAPASRNGVSRRSAPMPRARPIAAR